MGAVRKTRTRTRVGLSLIVLSMLCLAAVVRVAYVHDRTWEYRLMPSGAPPKVGFDDRDYLRGPEVQRLHAGLVRRGETMGGGVIYAPPGPGTATVIEVVDGSRVVEYALMGGP